MRHWKLLMAFALLVLIAGGLAACVSDEQHAENLARLSAQEAKARDTNNQAVSDLITQGKAAADTMAEDTKTQAGSLAALIPVPGAAVVGALIGGVFGDQRRRKMLAGVVKAIDVILKDDPNVSAAFEKNGTKLHAVMGDSAAAAVAKIRKQKKT